MTWPRRKATTTAFPLGPRRDETCSCAASPERCRPRLSRCWGWVLRPTSWSGLSANGNSFRGQKNPLHGQRGEGLYLCNVTTPKKAERLVLQRTRTMLLVRFSSRSVLLLLFFFGSLLAVGCVFTPVAVCHMRQSCHLFSAPRCHLPPKTGRRQPSGTRVHPIADRPTKGQPCIVVAAALSRPTF